MIYYPTRRRAHPHAETQHLQERNQMNTSELEFDFSGKKAVKSPHFRTTTLTINWDAFRRLKEMSPNEAYAVEFVNDIVSSCRGAGNNTDHHSIRRRDLLMRQFKGGFRKVKVRPTQGMSIDCLMVDMPVGNSDACSCVVKVCKPEIDKKGK